MAATLTNLQGVVCVRIACVYSGCLHSFVRDTFACLKQQKHHFAEHEDLQSLRRSSAIDSLRTHGSTCVDEAKGMKASSWWIQYYEKRI